MAKKRYPYKYTPTRCKMFVEALEKMNGVVAACEYAGISFLTYQKWYKTIPEFKVMVDEAFEKQIHKGKEIAIRAIFKAMDKNWTAGAWWLERNFSEYRRKEEQSLNIDSVKIRYILPEDDDSNKLDNPDINLLPPDDK